MNMLRIFLIAAIAALGLAACDKDEPKAEDDRVESFELEIDGEKDKVKVKVEEDADDSSDDDG